MLTLADMEGNETFDPAALGTADEVAEIRVADDAMVRRFVVCCGFTGLSLTWVEPCCFASVEKGAQRTLR